MKRALDQDVYEAALARIRHVYDTSDYVSVMFSGGKDSTVALQLTLEVARDLGRCPVEVVFFDEEVIPPETVEYVHRVSLLPDVALRWICHPVKHRNGCSRREPYWYPWDPEKQDKWVRDLPLNAVGLPESAKGLTMRDCAPFVNPRSRGVVGQIYGIRAQESLRRLRAVSTRIIENYVFSDEHMRRAFVIYDWTTEDVWTAPGRFGWDYNRAYDLMAMAGMTPFLQRVGPPYGEEPLQRFWTYSVCWPSLWERMLERVDGAPAAGRHARNLLYGNGGVVVYDDPMVEIERALARWPDDVRVKIAQQIEQEIHRHFMKTDEPIPLETPGQTGISWKFLLMKAKRGDLKNRRTPKLESGVEFEWMKK